MTSLGFPPQFPLPANPLALFGVLLLAGALGGELIRRVWPLPSRGLILMTTIW